jgi:hypothetical protein
MAIVPQSLCLSVVFLFCVVVEQSRADSICFGTRESGRLENGEPLPRSGPNFRAYSDIGWLAGRTYVHSKVKRTLVSAYQVLESTQPQKNSFTVRPVGKMGASLSLTKPIRTDFLWT